MSIRLTQFSHGAGCGCKLSSAVLDQILKSNGPSFQQTGLLVGNEDRDDAAAFKLPNGDILLSTTDFFTPIVDDPFDFGRVAATNALSDIYAMGGSPVLALALLGWPIDKLSAAIAGEVIAGARNVCRQVGLQIAGGHSIDTPEPIFGLAVNGLVQAANLKTNAGAKRGDVLFLTKPLGVGVLTTAEKKGQIKSDDRAQALKSMTTLNQMGETLARLPHVHALTDVTGFGLAGHLLEMCRAANLSAEIDFDSIALLGDLASYIAQGLIPGGGRRNWQNYSSSVHFSERAGDLTLQMVMADPQTSGGLLVAVDPQAKDEVSMLIKKSAFPECAIPLGQMVANVASQPQISVKTLTSAF